MNARVVGSVEVSVVAAEEEGVLSWALRDLHRKLGVFRAESERWKKELEEIYFVIKEKVVYHEEHSFKVWGLIAEHRHKRIGTGPFLGVVGALLGSDVKRETVARVENTLEMVLAYEREVVKTMVLIKTVEAGGSFSTNKTMDKQKKQARP